MIKLFKWIVGAIGTIVLLLVVVAIAVPLLFDPNDHKARIESLVKDETGRELKIQGDISLSLFPWLGFKVGRVSLGNAPGFEEANFASVEGMEIRVRLLPLLEKQVEMDTVAVNGLTLNLTRKANGENNWDDLAGAKKEAPTPAAGPPPVAALAIGGVDLRNASVAFDDGQNASRVALTNLKLVTGAVTPGQPVEVNAEFDFQASKPEAAGQVALSARLRPDLAAKRYDAENFQFSLAVTGVAIPGGSVKAEAKGNATFDEASGRLVLSDLELKSDNPMVAGINGEVAVRGNFTADLPGRDGAPGRYAAEGFQLTAALGGAAIPGGKVNAEAKGSATFDQASQRLALRGLELKSDNPGVPGLNGNVVVTGDIDADLASRDVSAGNFSVQGDVAGLVPEGRAKFEARGSARANLDSMALAVPDLSLRADSLAMQGLSGWLQADLGVAGNLKQRRFDLSAIKASGKFQGSALPLKGEVPLALTASKAALDLDKGTASLDAFDLDVQSLRSKGSVNATALLGSPRFAGQLEVAPFDLRALLASLNQPVPKTADPRTLTAASLSTQFKSDLKTVSLEKLRMKLDDTSLSGSLTAGLDKDAPLRFDLSVDALDADRYLPPAAQKAAATPATAAATAITLPVAELRALDAEGRLRAGKLKVAGLSLQDVDVGLSAKAGKIRLSPLKTALYGGRYSGNVQLDVSTDAPSVSVDEQIGGVNLAALIKDLKVDAGGIDFSGAPSSLHLKAAASGDPAGNRFRFKDLLLDADLGGRSFPGNRLSFSLRGNAETDLAKQAVSVDPLAAKFGPVTALGNLTVTGFLSDPRYTASIKAPDFNARELIKILGLEAPKTADPRALTRVGLNAGVSGNRNQVSFDPLTLVVDDTKLSGTLSLANLAAPLPAARFDLKANALDADRYLPPESKAKPATPGAAATVLPVDTLRALDVDGKLKVDQVKLRNLRLSNVLLSLTGKDGLVTLHPANAQLYQGSYNGNVRVDARGKVPTIAIDERIQNVQAGPLLKDLQGKALLTGVASVDAKLTAAGNDDAALKRSANGLVRARVVNGAIEGVDILGDLCKLLSTADIGSVVENPLGALFGIAASKAQASANETRFTEMSVSVQFKDGVAYSDDLDLRSPALRVGGKGKLLLDQMFLDYMAEPAIVSSCQGQGGQAFSELAGVPLPIQVKGVLPDVQTYPKFGQAVVQTLTRSRKQTTTRAAPAPQPQQPTQPAQPQKPEDVLKDAGKKAVGDLLRGILK